MNTKQLYWLRPCLESVLKNPYSGGPFEIIVLDNASEDGSVDRLRSEFPQVRVIAERIRRGFGENHTLVAQSVVSDFVLFLNPDTLMHPGTLDGLVSAFAADERVAVAGGPILDPDGEIWRAAPFGFPTPTGAIWQAIGLHRLQRRKAKAPDGVSVGVGWLSGSAFMVDRRVFLALGGFDRAFFLYFEETDYCYRLTEAGGLIAFNSDAPVTHEGRTTERAASSDGKLSESNTRTVTEFERSGIIYMRKHFGRVGAAAYRASLVASGGIRYLASWSRLRNSIDFKGDDLTSTRAHHKRRVGVGLKPRSGASIGDGAADFNEQFANRTS